MTAVPGDPVFALETMAAEVRLVAMERRDRILNMRNTVGSGKRKFTIEEISSLERRQPALDAAAAAFERLRDSRSELPASILQMIEGAR